MTKTIIKKIPKPEELQEYNYSQTPMTISPVPIPKPSQQLAPIPIIPKQPKTQERTGTGKEFISEYAKEDYNVPEDYKTGIKFNANGSVDYTSGNKTFNLSKDEYKAFLETKKGLFPKGQITPNIENLIAQEKEEKRRIIISKELEAGASTEAITKKLLEEEAKRQGIEEPTQEQAQEVTTPTKAPFGMVWQAMDLGTIAFVHPFQTLGAIISPEVTLQEVIDKHFSQDLSKQITETLVATASYGALALGVGEIVKGFQLGTISLSSASVGSKSAILNTALGFIWKNKFLLAGGGYVGKIFIGRQLSTSQSILSEDMALMGNINKLVASGDMSYTEALSYYKNTEQEISSAYSRITWITKNNLMVYLSGGMDTEIKFLNAQQILIPALRQELYESAQQGRLLRARANYGQ